MRNDLTYIVVVLDRSGSMESMREAAILGFNDFVDQLKAGDGEAILKLVQFDDHYDTMYQLPLHQVPRLTEQTFVPRGSTALLDAQGRTIDDLGQELAQLPEASRPGKVVVMTLTDGMENASRNYTVGRVSAMIRHQRDVYKWEFLYLGANQDAIGVASDMGIPQASALTFAATSVGVLHSLQSSASFINAHRSQPQSLDDGFEAVAFSLADRQSAMEEGELAPAP